MTDQAKLERQRAASKRYYWRHRDRERVRQKKWRDEHPEFCATKAREFREANPDYAKNWAEGHRENRRAADVRYREKDPPAYRKRKREQKRAWRENNPEKEAIACLLWKERSLSR